MELNVSQRKALRAALISAFPRQELLELMLEDELEEDLNRITHGQSNYDLVVRDLVKWAEGQGRLIELVVGASRQNPGNPEVRSFVTGSLVTLLGLESDNLSMNHLEALAIALQPIQDLEWITSCCCQTWAEIHIHRPQALKDLENPDLSLSVKWLVVLKLWLNEYRQRPDGTPCILDFVDRLRHYPKCPKEQQQRLSSLLAELQAELDYCLPTPTQALPFDQDKKIKSVQGYFLITVQIPITQAEESDRIFIQGFLSIKTDGQDSPSTLIPLQDLNVQTSVSSSSSGAQGGISGTLQQLEQQFPQWVHQAEERLSSECRGLRDAYSLPTLPSYKLTIEFFLPYEYLAEAVDLWEVSRPVLRRREMVAVGKKHRVVVRSSDRLQDGELLNRLIQTWEGIDAFLQNVQTEQSLQGKLATLTSLDCCELDALIQQFKQCLGLMLVCPVCIPELQVQRETVFLAALEAGVPIALWSRRHDLPNLSKELGAFLVLEYLRDLELLLEQVYNKRGRAFTDDDLGRHLAILCDEPKRIERLRQFFDSGRLSA
jgi:hypothetical protein